MMRNRAYRPYRGRAGMRIVCKVLLVLVAVALAAFVALEVVVAEDSRTKIEAEPDIMLILGCQVKSWGPSIMLQDRLDTALDYLEDDAPDDMEIVVSGGKGNDEHVSEAQAMYDYLVEHGVDGSRIHKEERSRNTSQNLKYSIETLKEMGYDPSNANVLIVSNGFHLARATMLAERYGMETSQLAAPSSHIPSKIQMFFREPLALVKSFLLD